MDLSTSQEEDLFSALSNLGKRSYRGLEAFQQVGE